MKIFVDRFTSDSSTIVSRAFINGQYFCFGLEGGFPTEKTPGKARIPPKTYKVSVHNCGELHTHYSKKFPGIHKGMLHILDVPNFECVLLHTGSWAKDTAGCLFVGEGAVTIPGAMMLTESLSAYYKLYSKVINAAFMGRLEIVFQDHDLIQEAA